MGFGRVEVGEGVWEVGSRLWAVSMAVMAAWNLGSSKGEDSLEDVMSGSGGGTRFLNFTECVSLDAPSALVFSRSHHQSPYLFSQQWVPALMHRPAVLAGRRTGVKKHPRARLCPNFTRTRVLLLMILTDMPWRLAMREHLFHQSRR